MAALDRADGVLLRQASRLAERVPHRDQLGVRLRQLGGGIGSGDDSTAGEEADLVRVGLAELTAAEGDRPFSVAIGVDPAHRSGVALAIQVLQLGDQ